MSKCDLLAGWLGPQNPCRTRLWERPPLSVTGLRYRRYFRENVLVLRIMGYAEVRTKMLTPEDRTMRMRFFLILFILLTICLGVSLAQTQDSSKPLERKIVRQTMPRYPEIAQKMNLAGTVKVMAVVAPDGKVTAVQPVGGSPVLLQAAQDAVSQWKFAPAGGESREVVELRFNPQAQP